VVRVEDSRAVRVEADPARLEQALTNMVSNALRHGDGDVVLRAGTERGRVDIHVLDDGPGFEPELLPHASERFARARGARAERGAGLGLSIVEVIAKIHGGHAYAQNRARGGADVWLDLPASSPRGETAPTEPSLSPSADR
jgi:signal transduction histidine kinase